MITIIHGILTFIFDIVTRIGVDMESLATVTGSREERQGHGIAECCVIC
jgi:hypothetical protein